MWRHGEFTTDVSRLLHREETQGQIHDGFARMARLVPRGNRQISGMENENRIETQSLPTQRLHATSNGKTSTSRLRLLDHLTTEPSPFNKKHRSPKPSSSSLTKHQKTRSQGSHPTDRCGCLIPARSLLAAVAKLGSTDLQSSVLRHDDPAVSGTSQRKQEDHSVQITPTAYWWNATGLFVIGANIDRCSTAPPFTEIAGKLALETWKDTKRKYTTATFCVIYVWSPFP